MFDTKNTDFWLSLALKIKTVNKSNFSSVYTAGNVFDSSGDACKYREIWILESKVPLMCEEEQRNERNQSVQVRPAKTLSSAFIPVYCMVILSQRKRCCIRLLPDNAADRIFNGRANLWLAHSTLFGWIIARWESYFWMKKIPWR